ncbi:30S ribosomal protein S21 [Blattabacterium sp. (Cryptocercus kyebangensis)]|uniref:30S ribosomal protein S21 n=1 Tax=Blattabacterium sp. (Cryptocercus kyebangensis) TaxID=298656 RepID=UPI000D7CCE2B|nr:30S ribosomal protein S21 [Blattabacterium sp. (Cryptocercus kyebangensis)]AWU43598.1 30S ribosomal protein S21 [Blattabacterium sp. (Cryptocercus kyebangensis)]
MVLITTVREGESIDKALKKCKKKFDKTRILKDFREKQQYIKPSEGRRNEILRAIYRERMRLKREE